MKIFYPALFRNHSGVLFQEGGVITDTDIASSEPPAFTFSLTLQSENIQDYVMPSSCPVVTYVSMNMSLTREAPLLMKVKPPHSFIGQCPVSAVKQ